MKNIGFFLVIAGLAFACSDDGGTPPPPQPMDFATYINSGGPAFSFDGINWEADKLNDASDSYENVVDIEGTENDQLYQTEVFDQDVFSYEIPVPAAGNWNVTLHFAEIFHGVENANGVGSRVFDVDIEGQASLSNYDIIEEAGGAATAVTESFTDIDVQDGNMTITFTAVVDAAKVSAVAVSGTYIP